MFDARKAPVPQPPPASSMNNTRSGFTLVELLMVVAIIAMISVLAVQRLSGLRDSSSERLNRANVVRIGSALETYAAANGRNASFDRLDALVLDGTADAGDDAGSTDDIGSAEGLLSYANAANLGLSSNVVASYSSGGYSARFPPLLGVYHLSAADARALHDDLGITYLMRAAAPDKNYHFASGADGAWAGQVDLSDPNGCSTIACAVSNGLAVAAVNPGSVMPWGDTIAPFGAAVYKAVGQDVQYRLDTQIQVDGVPFRTGKDAFDALRAPGAGGILVAFGLGDSAALVGKNVGGLDSAPVSPVVAKNEYGRYLVLVRLRRTATGAVKAEFAGVADPYGRTAAMLR